MIRRQLESVYIQVPSKILFDPAWKPVLEFANLFFSLDGLLTDAKLRTYQQPGATLFDRYHAMAVKHSKNDFLDLLIEQQHFCLGVIQVSGGNIRPSKQNERPTHFIVIDGDTLNSFVERCRKNRHVKVREGQLILPIQTLGKFLDDFSHHLEDKINAKYPRSVQ